MSTLAHVFEAAGLATITLISMRPVAEKMGTPRALYGEFPLGRPLGRPDDPAFQHDVLARAFALLEAPEGPVLADHPDVIESEEQPLACTLPPRFDPDLPPAVDEAMGLRAAYDRAVAARDGVSSIGRAIGADDIPALLHGLQRIVDGAGFRDAGLPGGGNTIALIHDLRAYYDEAATQLEGGAFGGGRASEAWFYEATEAGALVMAARAALRSAEAPFPVWFYMAPAHR